MGDYCKLFSRIWLNPDFAGPEGLDVGPQLLFLLLMSFGTRNNAGVLPLTIKRWARASRGGTVEAVEAALAILVKTRFILVDWETEEVLIRTFIRNDELYLQPNLMANALKDCEKVESVAIRSALQDELLRISTLMPVGKPAQEKVHEDTLTVAKSLVKTPSEGLGEPFKEPFTKPFPKPLSEPPGVGGYVSTVGLSPTPTPEPSPPPATTTATNPPSGDSQGVLAVVDAELVPEVADEKPTKDRRATRLKEDWRPSDEVISRMKKKYPTIALWDEFLKFQNHFIGKGIRWVDWNRCWWNWVAEAARRDGVAGGVRDGADKKAMGWEALKD